MSSTIYHSFLSVGNTSKLIIIYLMVKIDFYIATGTNKRPMGQIAHLRNQFKLMNTFLKSEVILVYIYYKIGQVVQEAKISFSLQW